MTLYCKDITFQYCFVNTVLISNLLYENVNTLFLSKYKYCTFH